MYLKTISPPFNISLTLFLIKIETSLSEFSNQLSLPHQSVLNSILSNGSFSCSFTNLTHLTPMSTAISSNRGIIIFLSGASLVLENKRSDFVSMLSQV